MAIVIRVNPAASPLRNVSFTGLASVAVGDRVPVRIELVNDARSGAAGYTPALFLGVRGTPLASVASWSASTVSGVAGWDGILRCDTDGLRDYVGLNASMTVMCQIVVEKNDTSELVTEAQNQVTVFSTVAPDGVYIPTPDTPTYSDLIALESTAVSAAAEASIDASLAASSAFAADSSADLAQGYADAALSSAVAADGSADAALSSAVVADIEASIAVSAASAAVAVVPSISAELALRVIKDAAGNTERLNTVNFTLDPVGVTHSEGVAHWSPDDHCLELGTDQAGVYLQVGQENLVRVRNVTGSTLLNGKVVYINGSTGQRPTVALADNTISASATKTIGVMTADLANNSDGYATTQGLVRDLNTSAFTDGATVYLGTAGNLTTTQPTAPNEIIRVGHVVKAHVTQGVLLVGVQHHQDAAEVPLASIVGISATDVQGAVSELASDITAETSARISGDASVSTALSTAISQRISADASLSTALSVETSRAVSVENTKAPLASPTFTGTQTLPDPRMGTGSAKAWAGSWAGGTTIGAAWAHGDFAAASASYALLQLNTGATYLNAASGQTVNFRIGNSQVAAFGSGGDFTVAFNQLVQGSLTASTITNYAADVTVSALLALTPAQSAAKRKATVTGAYRMDGTLGRVEAWWDGDASAGTWDLTAAPDVRVTALPFTFARDVCLSRYVPDRFLRHNNTEASWGGSLNKLMVERFFPTINADVNMWSLTGGAAVTRSYGGANYRFLGLTLPATANATLRDSVDMFLPRWAAASAGSRGYARVTHGVSNGGFSADGCAFAVGMIDSGSSFGSAVATVALVIDPLNLYGLGISNSNIHIVSRTTSGVTVQDTLTAELVTIDPTSYHFELTGGATISCYRNNTKLGNDASTNVPDFTVAYRMFFDMRRGGSAGANAPIFRFIDCATAKFA